MTDVIRTRDTITETFRRRDQLTEAIAQLGRAYSFATGAAPFEAMRAADGITVAAGDSPNMLRVVIRALPFNAGCEWVITDAFGNEGEVAATFIRSALRQRSPAM